MGGGCVSAFSKVGSFAFTMGLASVGYMVFSVVGRRERCSKGTSGTR